MNGPVEIVCCRPKRRDALFEAARLALNFLEVSTRPGRSSMLSRPQDRLRLYLGLAALVDGAPGSGSSLILLRALETYGVPILRMTADGEGRCPPEWKAWWTELEQGEPGTGPDALRLEIV